MRLGVGQNECGNWEITFDGIFAPENEAQQFKTEGAARRACEQMAAEWRHAERMELCADGAALDW